MRKPAKGSDGTLTGKKLYEIIKTKDQWNNVELLEHLLPIYDGYDKEGLGHRMRQILSEYAKKGLLKKIESGVYSANV